VLEKQIKAVTANEWRLTITKLVEFIGHGDADRLRAEDIDRWRDNLLAEQKNDKRSKSHVTVRDKYVAQSEPPLEYEG